MVTRCPQVIKSNHPIGSIPHLLKSLSSFVWITDCHICCSSEIIPIAKKFLSYMQFVHLIWNNRLVSGNIDIEPDVKPLPHCINIIICFFIDKRRPQHFWTWSSMIKTFLSFLPFFQIGLCLTLTFYFEHVTGKNWKLSVSAGVI